MTERDIIHDTGRAWVYQDRQNARYTVFLSGLTHSTSDSAYPLTPDGLSIAKARADYLNRKAST